MLTSYHILQDNDHRLFETQVAVMKDDTSLIIAVVALSLSTIITVAFGVLAGCLCCALHIVRAEVALLRSTLNTSADEFSLKELRHDGRNTPAGVNTEHTSVVTLVHTSAGSNDASSSSQPPPGLPCKPVAFKQQKTRAVTEEQDNHSRVPRNEVGLQLSASDYNLPADAIPHLGKKGESPQTRKISFNLASCPGEGNYSDVFDKIQSDRIQVVGSPLKPAALPRSSPDAKSPLDVGCPVVQTWRNGAVVLEGSRTLPRASNTPSGDGADLTSSDNVERRLSLPQSRQPSSKELVELDPRKRIFRLESQKRKRPAGGAGEEDRDAAKENGGDAAMSESHAVEYSVVNMVEKLNNRSGESSFKPEVSGTPIRCTPDDGGVTA